MNPALHWKLVADQDQALVISDMQAVAVLYEIFLTSSCISSTLSQHSRYLRISKAAN